MNKEESPLGHVSHQAIAHPGFLSIKRLDILLLSWDGMGCQSSPCYLPPFPTVGRDHYHILPRGIARVK